MVGTKIFRGLVSILPPDVLRFFGRLQFRIPLLRPIIRRVAHHYASSEGVIRHGIGAGLRFDSNGRAGFLLGTSAPEEQHLLSRLLKPGATFYDIGANVGFYSTIAARLVGPHGYVYAFEPFGPSADLARKNARLNGFENVTVVEAALMNEQAIVRLQMGNRWESAHYRIGNGVAGNSVEVSAISLDWYILQTAARAPDIVLVDVEGAEIEALHGMLGTIKAHRPIIMCEIHWTGDSFREFFDRNLIELGYEATTYAGQTLPTEICRFHALLLPAHARPVSRADL